MFARLIVLMFALACGAVHAADNGAANPRVLLDDEWLAGLNPTELNQAIDLLRGIHREGMTIVMVEHVMDAIRSLCSRCVVMNLGTKIAEGGTDAVLSDRNVMEAYLGVE